MKSKAWQILNKDEKTALMLTFNQKKSSWEAGEIMDKSHYKYLEIKSRAEFFFRRFTEYFDQTGDLLIPENMNIPLDFREFIHHTIEDRFVYSKTLEKLDINSQLRSNNHRVKKQTLITYFLKLRNSEDLDKIALYDIISDFDRWNNFRILPEILQEPSAFKRRNKTRLLKHLKNLKNIDEFNIYRFTKKFKTKKKGKRLFLPLVCDNLKGNYKVVPIDKKKALVEYLSKEFKLYIFIDEKIANDYVTLVSEYLSLEQKNSKRGQKFWPEFRKIIEKAYNYNLVNNIIPRRKNLENSFREIDFNLKSSKKIVKIKSINI